MPHIKNIGPITFDTSKILGSGSTGYVYKGIFVSKLGTFNPHWKKQVNKNVSQAEQEIAVKVIPHAQRCQNEVTEFLYHSEKLALKHLNNRSNIIRCFGQFEDHQNSYLAMQYVEGGTLKEFLDQKKILSQSVAIDILYKLLKGLKEISGAGFVHRDIKSTNVMIKKSSDKGELEPIYIDFGYCQHQYLIPKPKMFYNVGSPSYMSPQSYNLTQYSPKSDLWSLGVVFYEMLMGETIEKNLEVSYYFSFTQQAINQKLKAAKINLTKKSLEILKYILNPNKSQRPSVQEALEFVRRKTQLKFPIHKPKTFHYEFKLLKQGSKTQNKQQKVNKVQCDKTQDNSDSDNSKRVFSLGQVIERSPIIAPSLKRVKSQKKLTIQPPSQGPNHVNIVYLNQGSGSDDTINRHQRVQTQFISQSSLPISSYKRQTNTNQFHSTNPTLLKSRSNNTILQPKVVFKQNINYDLHTRKSFNENAMISSKNVPFINPQINRQMNSHFPRSEPLINFQMEQQPSMQNFIINPRYSANMKHNIKNIKNCMQPSSNYQRSKACLLARN